MLDNSPDLMTLKDMMKVLHIGKNTALDLIHTNTITAHKVKKQWRIFKEDIIEYIIRS